MTDPGVCLPRPPPFLMRGEMESASKYPCSPEELGGWFGEFILGIPCSTISFSSLSHILWLLSWTSYFTSHRMGPWPWPRGDRGWKVSEGVTAFLLEGGRRGGSPGCQQVFRVPLWLAREGCPPGSRLPTSSDSQGITQMETIVLLLRPECPRQRANGSLPGLLRGEDWLFWGSDEHQPGASFCSNPMESPDGRKLRGHRCGG